jgi:molybdenum cofactor biosynthesis protein MoaC
LRNIAHKNETHRTAVAESVVQMNPSTMDLLKHGKAPKGDPLPHARIAAVMAVKKTWELIPYCHPLLIDAVTVDFGFDDHAIKITVTVTAVAKTGVEMEALAGASVAALTIYDMLKPVDKSMEILGCRLLDKKGGKSDLPKAAPDGFKVAVLVISDSTAAGLRIDSSGAAVAARLKEMGVSAPTIDVVADETEAISAKLIELAQNCDLVLTTGGTGLGPRDVTAAATRAVIDRETPGIAETMRTYGQRRTPFAMLSQGIAGLRGRCLIVNLPGSPSGVEQSIAAIFPGIFHAFPIIAGDGHLE